MKTVRVVVDQHAEEAALIWLRRDQAVGQPHYVLADLAELDESLDAHLDGLRIAGDTAWEVCREELRWQEPGEVFPAAVLALESGDRDRIDTVLKAADASHELSRPMVSALAWLPFGQIADQIDRLLVAESPPLRRMGIAASAAHRHDPGRALVEALDHPDTLLRARALRAVGELGRADLLPELERQLAAEEPLCRFSAAWSAAVLSKNPESLLVLKEIVRSAEPGCHRGLQLVLRRLDVSEAKDWIRQLAAASPELARSAVIGAGVLGLPEMIPRLIDRMQAPELARVAGEVFASITGIDIADEDLEGDWPKGFVAGPTDDPDDENVGMDPDENLPWPDRGTIHRWWQQHQDRFVPGTRYLLGRPLGVDWLEDVLRVGRQRQRAAAALELAILRPGQPLFEVRAPAFRQQQWLCLQPNRRP